MRIPVKDAFISHTYHKEYEFEFPKELLEDFTDGVLKDIVKACVVISSQSGVVTCEINVKTVFEVSCSRCLLLFDMPFEFTVKKIVRREQDEDFEDVIYTDASLCIDIYEEIRTQIYFEFPTKPLCKEDCKGLCPVCGCDLNTESCSCDIKTVDPRLAILKKLSDK